MESRLGPGGSRVGALWGATRVGDQMPPRIQDQGGEEACGPQTPSEGFGTCDFGGSDSDWRFWAILGLSLITGHSGVGSVSILGFYQLGSVWEESSTML